MKNHFFVVAIFASFFSLSAQTSFNWFGSGNVFSLSAVEDCTLLSVGVALSGGDLILDNVLELNRKTYDSSKIYNKNDVNPFDRFFMNEYSSSLDKTADVGVALSMLTPVVLLTTQKEEWLTVGVMYAETLLIANGLKEITKLCVNRERPYMYYDSSTYPKEDLKDGDFANSFPSGHATMSFAGATFASYTFCKYFPDSLWRYGVVAGSYALALGTSTLRVLSGNHFMSDVLTGAALGSAVGFLVPALHTFNKKSDLNVALLPTGILMRVKL
mgnify:CR=1 FL=1